MTRWLLALCLLVSTQVMATGEYLQKDNLFPRVKLVTTEGDIVIELDRMRAALTANNFLSYVDKKIYEGTIFHRLEPEFVLQGGGYDRAYLPVKSLKEIPNESGNGLKNRVYTVAMAHQEKGPHTASNQFFINLNDNPSLNPGKNWGYAVFGSVVEGIETIEKIKQIETGLNEKLGWETVPKKPIVILKVILLPAK
jgi:peptidyl-prolyl cis-trans isomerase A (cyclophilin A)